jgi:hypothetical protein
LFHDSDFVCFTFTVTIELGPLRQGYSFQNLSLHFHQARSKLPNFFLLTKPSTQSLMSNIVSISLPWFTHQQTLHVETASISSSYQQQASAHSLHVVLSLSHKDLCEHLLLSCGKVKREGREDKEKKRKGDEGMDSIHPDQKFATVFSCPDPRFNF